jgi:hypothetical protein
MCIEEELFIIYDELLFMNKIVQIKIKIISTDECKFNLELSLFDVNFKN